MRFSIVIPTLNEAAHIVATLQPLQSLRSQGYEVIVVDGGSTDRTQALAEPLCDKLLLSDCGRARQMNAGAAVASGDWLWFLHADTQLPANLAECLQRIADSDCQWGRFDVRLSGSLWALRLIESMINLRSRLSGIATGDQGIFVRAETFVRLGGFPTIPLMEDVALSKQLKQVCRPLCLADRLITSSRRWEQQGVARTVLQMWQCRLLYWLGMSAERLHAHYYHGASLWRRPSKPVSDQ